MAANTGDEAVRVVWQHTDDGGPFHQPSPDTLDAFLQRYQHRRQGISTHILATSAQACI